MFRMFRCDYARCGLGWLSSKGWLSLLGFVNHERLFVCEFVRIDEPFIHYSEKDGFDYSILSLVCFKFDLILQICCWLMNYWCTDCLGLEREVNSCCWWCRELMARDPLCVDSWFIRQLLDLINARKHLLLVWTRLNRVCCYYWLYFPLGFIHLDSLGQVLCPLNFYVFFSFLIIYMSTWQI